MAKKSTLRKEQIKRIINFYELELVPHKDNLNPNDAFLELSREVIKIGANKDPQRHKNILGKVIYVQNVKIDALNKQVYGLIRSIRSDLFPEIYNLTTDLARAIEASEDEGIVETTHFSIDYSGTKNTIGIEYNYQGAKLTDLVYYLQLVGQSNLIVGSINYIPIVKKDLVAEVKKLNKCSEFTVKIKSDRIAEVKAVDDDLFTLLDTASRSFESDYATVVLKYDYKNSDNTLTISKLINKLAGIFKRKPETASAFEIVQVKAENSENNNILETIDMLVDKVRVHVWVEKNIRHKTVVSSDMFNKIKEELKRLIRAN